MKSLLLLASGLLYITISQAQWSAGGIQLSSTPTSNYTQQIVVSNTNSFWEVWRAEDTTASFKGTIYLTGIDRHGVPLSGFGSGAILIGDSGDYYMPQIIMSDDSNIIASWYGYADTSSSLSHIYLQKFTQAGIPLWNNGNPVRVTLSDLHHNKFPQIASDKSNGVYVCWTQYDQNLSPSSADVLIQRYDSNGNIASGWSATPVSAASIVNIRESYPRIAVTPSGDAVYVQYFKGLITTLTLNLTRLNAADGSTAPPFATGSGIQMSAGPYLIPVLFEEMSVLCDSAGNALSVWDEYRTSINGEIYYQKTSPAGTLSFAANGKKIAGNNQNGYGYLHVNMDDDGDLLAVWNDYVSNYDAGCAKFEAATGNIIWQHSTTPLTTNHNSAYPKIISDHLGGCYIFYSDISTSVRKIYCLRLDALGTLQWNLPGLLVGNMSNQNGFDPQFDFEINNVDSQQTTVTWVHADANFMYDVFACNVLPSMQSCFDAPTGIQSVSNPVSGFTMSPNPATDEFTVTASENSLQALQFFLYDETGKMVLRKSFKNSVLINTKDLPGGIYLGKIADENGNYSMVQKIMLQK